MLCNSHCITSWVSHHIMRRTLSGCPTCSQANNDRWAQVVSADQSPIMKFPQPFFSLFWNFMIIELDHFSLIFCEICGLFQFENTCSLLLGRFIFIISLIISSLSIFCILSCWNPCYSNWTSWIHPLFSYLFTPIFHLFVILVYFLRHFPNLSSKSLI